MKLLNTTDETEVPLSFLSNCTVDTSYRFTFYQVSYSIIFLLGIVTNSLALHRLCQAPRSMNSTAIYMVSLSAADVCFVISLPLRIYFYNQKAKSPSSRTPAGAYCYLTFVLKYISLYGGIFFLVCIAVDRYLAVVHPLASLQRRQRVAQLLSGGVWCLVLGLSVCLPLLHYAAAHEKQACLLDPSFQHHRTIILVALGLVFWSFLVPTLVLVYSYCRVLSVLQQPRHGTRGQSRSRQHTLRLIYRVLGVFLLCYVPYHINLLGYTLTHVGLVPHCGLAKVTRAVHPVVLTLASSNCCLNPLVYYFSSSLVQRQAQGGGGSSSH